MRILELVADQRHTVGVGYHRCDVAILLGDMVLARVKFERPTYELVQADSLRWIEGQKRVLTNRIRAVYGMGPIQS